MTSLYNGGAEKSLVNLLNEIDPSEYDVDLLLLKKRGLFLNQVPEWVNILDVPQGVKLMYTPELVKGHVVSKAQRLVTNVFFKTFERRDCYARAYRWKYLYSKKIEKIEKKYDIAVAYITGELLYFLCEKVNAKRKVLWVHNDYEAEGQPREFDLPYMEKVDAIVSISEQCINVLKKVFPIYKNKIYEIHNITSSKIIRKQSDEFFPSEYKNTKNIIVSVGRLAPQKGFDLAIEAASILKASGLNFTWNIIGTGALEDELKKKIEEKNVTDVIHLLGARQNPYPYIKNADILAQTSRYEGKSVVLDEAKILAVPILVTEYPTVKDQIINGKEGIIVDMLPEKIAQGIIELLEQSDKRKRLVEYLSANEYGNQDEISKYYQVLNG